jgi:surface antigen
MPRNRSAHVKHSTQFGSNEENEMNRQMSGDSRVRAIAAAPVPAAVACFFQPVRFEPSPSMAGCPALAQMRPTRSLARLFVRCVTGVALLAVSAGSVASNLNFLKDTPISFMREADRKALNDAAQKALEKKDGEVVPWSNAGTGNPVAINGTITPHDTSTKGDRTCRTTTLVANAKGQTQSWTPTVCKTAGGPWKILRK